MTERKNDLRTTNHSVGSARGSFLRLSLASPVEMNKTYGIVSSSRSLH